MDSSDSADMRLHEDVELFREVVTFTAAQTRFAPRVIEKDYFCSLLIAHLTAAERKLVFKGGTCLAKVHADFYRLSEDLDWLISTPADATRSHRSSLAAGSKKAVSGLSQTIRGLRLETPLSGANRSTQYVAVVAFRSITSGEDESIKIEIGLREPLLEPAVQGQARTLLLDPISGQDMVSPIPVTSMSMHEAYAEKLRAALSRREPAIRDFFDVDDALQRARIRTDDRDMIQLVRQKLAVPGNAPVDVSPSRLESLRRQVDAQLKPVLRSVDFERFDLERAFAAVDRIADLVLAG